MVSNTVFSRVPKLTVLSALTRCTEACLCLCAMGSVWDLRLGLEAQVAPFTVALDVTAVLKGRASASSSPMRQGTQNRAVLLRPPCFRGPSAASSLSSWAGTSAVSPHGKSLHSSQYDLPQVPHQK